ncbi:MAG: indole-3-glycerol phosphate synthase TrpC [Microthrixaceae bacterium]|nr:indole-3-glycerol-phosphate synthase [Microthrixaceae bacterium]MCO5317899.1 indole-3-glycerol phosphate synthase TrpC [Microthrixaceae bacterium]
MGTYLDAILEHHRDRARSDRRRTEDLLDAARGLGAVRGFTRAIQQAPTLAVIAEVKRRSPSKGDLASELDPGGLAAAYEHAGASCVSVLTDRPHFGGSPEDLAAARSSVSVPVLRKDFTVAENDVLDARMMGADAVLLIVAALDDAQLAAFDELAAEVGLDTLVEVHDEAELERALGNTRGTLIGVNQRDLETFEVDQQRAVRVAAEVPAGAVSVAESGVRGRPDATALSTAGYDAVLVGELLVTSAEPAAMLTELLVPRG